MAEPKRPSPSLSSLIQGDEGIQQLLSTLEGLAQGAARGLTVDTAGAPVDILASALNAIGVPVGDKPAGGSQWMRAMLDQPAEDSGASTVGNLLSALVSPGKAATDVATLTPALAGIFMGPKSRTWDKEAAEYLTAVLQDPNGRDPEVLANIFKHLNVFESPGDKMLRQEIPDTGSKLSNRLNLGTDFLGNVLDHPELYKAYPELKRMPVKLEDNPDVRSLGSYIPPATPGGQDAMRINLRQKDPRSTILHELQHAVQNREGFARGGSPEEFKPGETNFDKAMKAGAGKNLTADRIADILYYRLAGEAEARAVQERANVDAENLRQFEPYIKDLFAYDVNPQQLIVKPR